MTISVVTAHTTDYQSLADRTRPTLESYAEKWGYRFYYNSAIPADMGAFGKLQAILGAFDEGADIALWIDSDAVITNPDIRIEDLTDHPAALTLTADILGTNTGVMLCQNCPLLRQFFWACLGFGKAVHGIKGWAEQSAIRDLMRTPPYNEPGFIRHVPQRVMNSYLMYPDGRPNGPDAAWQVGDFILHMPGMAMEHRHAVLDQLEAQGVIQTSTKQNSEDRGCEQERSGSDTCVGVAVGESAGEASESQTVESEGSEEVEWFNVSPYNTNRIYPVEGRVVCVRFGIEGITAIPNPRQEFVKRIGEDWKSPDDHLTYGGVTAWRFLTPTEKAFVAFSQYSCPASECAPVPVNDDGWNAWPAVPAPHHEPLFAYVDDGENRHLVCAHYWEDVGYWINSDTHVRIDSCVTHWRPMPPLPA